MRTQRGVAPALSAAELPGPASGSEIAAGFVFGSSSYRSTPRAVLRNVTATSPLNRATPASRRPISLMWISLSSGRTVNRQIFLLADNPGGQRVQVRCQRGPSVPFEEIHGLVGALERLDGIAVLLVNRERRRLTHQRRAVLAHRDPRKIGLPGVDERIDDAGLEVRLEALLLSGGREGDLMGADGGRHHAPLALFARSARNGGHGLIVEGHFQRGKADIGHADHRRRLRQQGGVCAGCPAGLGLFGQVGGNPGGGNRACAAVAEEHVRLVRGRRFHLVRHRVEARERGDLRADVIELSAVRCSGAGVRERRGRLTVRIHERREFLPDFQNPLARDGRRVAEARPADLRLGRRLCLFPRWGGRRRLGPSLGLRLRHRPAGRARLWLTGLEYDHRRNQDQDHRRRSRDERECLMRSERLKGFGDSGHLIRGRFSRQEVGAAFRADARVGRDGHAAVWTDFRRGRPGRRSGRRGSFLHRFHLANVGLQWEFRDFLHLFNRVGFRQLFHLFDHFGRFGSGSRRLGLQFEIGR